MFINQCFFKMDANFKTSVKARKLSGSTVMGHSTSNHPEKCKSKRLRPRF